ncbi:hypothetical protein AURDEDRAFT_168679 [Auricularia subglabra TFB-10046 SS5]|nr:hypothetical protein AURDEDRAFT_168679 [Auricularia subglabra TFB-10046 SS5]
MTVATAGFLYSTAYLSAWAKQRQLLPLDFVPEPTSPNSLDLPRRVEEWLAAHPPAKRAVDFVALSFPPSSPRSHNVIVAIWKKSCTCFGSLGLQLEGDSEERQCRCWIGQDAFPEQTRKAMRFLQDAGLQVADDVEGHADDEEGLWTTVLDAEGLE